MWPAFPTSNYYELSAPCPRHQSATDLPTRTEPAARLGWDPRQGSRVHCQPFDGIGIQLCPCTIAMTTPQAFTMASRADDILQHGSSPLRNRPIPEQVRGATQPMSARFGAGGCA